MLMSEAKWGEARKVKANFCTLDFHVKIPPINWKDFTGQPIKIQFRQTRQTKLYTCFCCRFLADKCVKIVCYYFHYVVCLHLQLLWKLHCFARKSFSISHQSWLLNWFWKSVHHFRGVQLGCQSVNTNSNLWNMATYFQRCTGYGYGSAWEIGIKWTGKICEIETRNSNCTIVCIMVKCPCLCPSRGRSAPRPFPDFDQYRCQS